MFKILKIIVLTSSRTHDTIMLHTDLPPSHWPWKENGNLQLDVASEKGEKYARDNFPGVEIEVIKM